MKREQHVAADSELGPAVGANLLDLDACETRTAPSGAEAGSKRTRWWVRSCAVQTRGTRGLPAAFKHTLMWGGRVIQSGAGADCHRTFNLQASFLNQRGATPLRKIQRTSSTTACMADQPDLFSSNPSA